MNAPRRARSIPGIALGVAAVAALIATGSTPVPSVAVASSRLTTVEHPAPAPKLTSAVAVPSATAAATFPLTSSSPAPAPTSQGGGGGGAGAPDAPCMGTIMDPFNQPITSGGDLTVQVAEIGTTMNDFTATVKWGDEAPVSATVTPDWANRRLDVTATRHFAKPGDYVEVTTVREGADRICGRVRSVIEVGGAGGGSPMPTPTPPSTPAAGPAIPSSCYGDINGELPLTVATGTRTLNVAGISSTYNDFTATVSFGAGSSVAATLTQTSVTTFDFTVVHTFAAAGTYTLSTTLHQASSGCTVTVPLSVTVS